MAISATKLGQRMFLDTLGHGGAYGSSRGKNIMKKLSHKSNTTR